MDQVLVNIGRELGLAFSAAPDPRKQIENRIRDLLLNDLNAFTSLLYRLDVNENKIRQALDSRREDDAAVVITELIIERQLERTRSRKTDWGFRKDDEIPDEEKW